MCLPALDAVRRVRRLPAPDVGHVGVTYVRHLEQMSDVSVDECGGPQNSAASFPSRCRSSPHRIRPGRTRASLGEHRAISDALVIETNLTQVSDWHQDQHVPSQVCEKFRALHEQLARQRRLLQDERCSTHASPSGTGQAAHSAVSAVGAVPSTQYYSYYITPTQSHCTDCTNCSK